MATLVKFRKDRDDNSVWAAFPQLKQDKKHLGNDIITCYSHIGQHSACQVDYMNACDKATESEYADLKAELESIGYKLKICK